MVGGRPLGLNILSWSLVGPCGVAFCSTLQKKVWLLCESAVLLRVQTTSGWCVRVQAVRKSVCLELNTYMGLHGSEVPVKPEGFVTGSSSMLQPVHRVTPPFF